MKYSEKKAAQVAAFFILHSGGRIEILKLMKLMYLAERESLARYGEPITGDRLVSMNHGPVLSITYDHMNNCIESEQDGWNDWISDRENHFLGLNKECKSEDELLELSDADIDILKHVYKQFSHMSAFGIRDYTHDNCPEWEDPNYSSSPIPYTRVLKHVGFSQEIAAELHQRINEQQKLDKLFNHAG